MRITPNQLALLLGKEVRQAVADGELKKTAVARIASKHGVSVKTAQRADELFDAVDRLAGIVFATTGGDLMQMVQDPAGPSRKQVVDAAKMLAEAAEMAEWVGHNLDDWRSPDGRPIKQVVAEHATSLHRKRRVDSVCLAATWQNKLASFERAMNRTWRRSNIDDRQIIARAVSVVLKKFYRQKPPETSQATS